MTRRMSPARLRLVPAMLLGVVATGVLQSAGTAQAPGRTPTATLHSAPLLQLPGNVDSNSPVVWDLVRGQPRLFVMTSSAGQPRVTSGFDIDRMGTSLPTRFIEHPGHGVWMEGVIQDEGGTWYGFYHNERPVEGCGREGMVRPRIGAARSTNRGLRWRDLGAVIEAPDGSDACYSPNRYFVGGVGDVGVVLDQDHRYLYLFFSQYGRAPAEQGVGVARMPWAGRDRPRGRLDAWVQGAWVPMATQTRDPETGAAVWHYRAASPLVRVGRPWHDGDRADDGFWGATVHWNTELGLYVMLLNRTADNNFTQEGIYVSFADRLDVPSRWTSPRRLLRGGNWYPQVVGSEFLSGTDKIAGRSARFFMGGASNYFIDFAYR